MWRPKGWVFGRGIAPGSKKLMFCEQEKPLKMRTLTDGEKELFELGADAMLEALKEDGLDHSLDPMWKKLKEEGRKLGLDYPDDEVE